LQTDEAKEDDDQGAYAADIRALAKKDHSDDCCSGGADPDKSRVDRCRRQVLDRFCQQKICWNSTNQHDEERRPSRQWRGPFQYKRPCDFEKVCEYYVKPSHLLRISSAGLPVEPIGGRITVIISE